MAKRYYLFIFFSLFEFIRVFSQSISGDDYFQMARKAAFEKNDYPAAIQLSRQALLQSPGYTDIQVFLGRVYYWNKQPDSSVFLLKAAVASKPGYEDASIAITDIEYCLEH